MTFKFPVFADFDTAARMGPPMPNTLKTAQAEILRLRRVVNEAHVKWVKAVENREEMKKSMMDEILHYKKLLGLA
jgi:hypothetical protein